MTFIFQALLVPCLKFHCGERPLYSKETNGSLHLVPRAPCLIHDCVLGCVMETFLFFFSAFPAFRCGLQFLGNIASRNEDSQSIVWVHAFPELFM